MTMSFNISIIIIIGLLILLAYIFNKEKASKLDDYDTRRLFNGIVNYYDGTMWIRADSKTTYTTKNGLIYACTRPKKTWKTRMKQ